MMFLIMVVFPVPGPPVMIVTLFSFTNSKASFCFSDSSMLDVYSTFFSSAFKFDILFMFFAFCSRFIRKAISCSVV